MSENWLLIEEVDGGLHILFEESAMQVVAVDPAGLTPNSISSPMVPYGQPITN